MSMQAAGTPVPNQNEWPLRFDQHSFDAICYNTYGCKVVYARTVEREDPVDRASPAPRDASYRDRWGFASHIGIENFPPPAKVSWRSLDGTAHEAEVDIGEIFKDGLVLHNVSRAEIPTATKAHVGGPSIFLEVNDRTIRVFMSDMIFTRDPKTGEEGSRHDLIEAWKKTY